MWLFSILKHCDFKQVSLCDHVPVSYQCMLLFSIIENYEALKKITKPFTKVWHNSILKQAVLSEVQMIPEVVQIIPRLSIGEWQGKLKPKEGRVFLEYECVESRALID